MVGGRGGGDLFNAILPSYAVKMQSTVGSDLLKIQWSSNYQYLSINLKNSSRIKNFQT